MDLLFAKRTKTRGAQTKFGQMGLLFLSPKRKLYKELHCPPLSTPLLKGVKIVSLNLMNIFYHSSI